MRQLIQRLVRRFKSDEGVALPLIAMMLVVLIGMAAFATDLGWFYLNASRIQRAADAGALAGVIRMPQDFAQATLDARATTRANTYEHGVDSVDVFVAEIPGDPNQLDVTVTDTVDTFFARLFGLETVTIARSARAEFIPALKLGSPENQFGNSCDPEEFTGCGDNFWANIHGHHTDTIMGDAFSSACKGGNGTCTGTNNLWRDKGYLYGVEANGAGSFTVQVNDLVFHNSSGTTDTGDYVRTGDRGCEAWGTDDADCGPTMYIALYAPDPDPLDVDTDTPICDQTLAPQPQVAETVSYTFDGLDSCFTVNSPGDGTYVLQIKVLDTGGNDDGLNRYSLRVTPSGASLFALGDMSIYNNSTGTITEFYLAEVEDFYAGKTFVVELYDAGESSETGTLQVIDPSGNVFNDGPCSIYSSSNPSSGWTLQGTPSSCQESVTKGEYNGKWLKFEMSIPSGYSCGTACWWKMNYDYTSGVNDTTTWRAYILGNPIHLIPRS